MSHWTTIKTQVRDLAALEQAGKELGLIFVRGQKTAKWYGAYMGDSPLPAGMTREQLGKCDHVLRLPGCEYEIAVIADPNTLGAYSLAFDFWGPGEALKRAIGEDGKRLIQLYGVHKAMSEARKKGLFANRETMANGSIRVAIQAR